MDKLSPAAARTISFMLMAMLPEFGRTAEPVWNPRTAAKYLDGRAGEWLRWDGAARGQGTVCLSCHTSMPFAVARAALGGPLNEPAPGDAEKQLLDSISKRVENW